LSGGAGLIRWRQTSQAASNTPMNAESVQQASENALRDLRVVSSAGQRTLLVEHAAPFHDHQQRYAHCQLEHVSAAIHRQPQAQGDQHDRDQRQHDGRPVEVLHSLPDGGQVAEADQGDLAEVAGRRDSLFTACRGGGAMGNRRTVGRRPAAPCRAEALRARRRTPVNSPAPAGRWRRP
jgi:hypothetical protein